MRVLLLTPVSHYLTDALQICGDTYETSMDSPSKWPDSFDFIVSFGYRYVIKEPILSNYRDKAINIHVSLLPWNKGADPNFWSWFNQTPKGVSIHLIDEEIDGGDILTQCEISAWAGGHTLKTSYNKLITSAVGLFNMSWPWIRRGECCPVEQRGRGTVHKAGEKDQWMNKLPLGWDTPVKEVEELGSASKDN